MPSGSDKWIRSIKDNPSGKVVADPEGNRWQWESEDDTFLQLKKLTNDELAIEQTDLHPRPELPAAPKALKARSAAANGRSATRSALNNVKKPKRDAGGGFNPYDSGTPKRR
jgi:hypothetical protein